METVTKSTTLTKVCQGCEQEMTGDRCENIECPEVQARAVVGASRTTAKTTTDASGVKAEVQRPQPRSFNAFGGVD